MRRRCAAQADSGKANFYTCKLYTMDMFSHNMDFASMQEPGYSVQKAQQGQMANCSGLSFIIVLKLKVILPQKLF
jgi:hypothetical protein